MGRFVSDAPLMTSQVMLRRFPPSAAAAIVEGRRLDSWAADYPAEGDVVIAGLLHDAVADDAGGDTFLSHWGHWQVVERSSGLVIGGIGFLAPPARGTVEIGYGIVPSHQGRGYATDAVRAVVRWASAQSSVTEIVAGTDGDNLASQRVLEKVGFRRVEREGDISFALTVRG
jgi:[ribosomal protein S5]-alanine N-acetyltransferase